MRRACCLVLLAVLSTLPSLAAGDSAASGGNAPVLKTRGPRVATGHRTSRRTAEAAFGSCVLRAVAAMPQGGGYSTDDDAMEALACKAIVWDDEKNGLRLYPKEAQPTFCSAACYVVLLNALRQWCAAHKYSLSSRALSLMMPELRQPDGLRVWGRVNANGPGLAKLVADTHTGVNFNDLRFARPGDFLKFFWSEDIGSAERGHMVVFLGTEKVKDKICIRYWSANKPDGCSIRSVPVDLMHHLIFTRITHPENFANVTRLPECDPMLVGMQQRPYTWQEVVSACRIILPSPKRP